MAETAKETAPNGKKPNEDAKSEGPVKLSSTDDSSEKGPVSVSKTSKDEVAGESKTKISSDTKAAEVVAKESTGAKKGTEEPMKEVNKSSMVIKGDSQNPGDAKVDPTETKVKDGHNPDEAKGAEAKDDMEIDADASKNESKKPVAEQKVSMEIDEKIEEKVEEKTVPKGELKAGVVLNPKKKGGRPKRSTVEVKPIEEPMEAEEPPKEEVKETKKRSRQKREPPVTPLSERDRPARERKSIERFVASVDKGKKELVIKQGTGTPLMDIPNVAYKLGKRAKGDEILNMLHSLLYNKRGKANALKYNIYRFSGFVWGENEEKEKNKVKEKLERYTKEGLGQLIDVLDLHLPKTGKKEELVVKVLQFLESPHKTTDVSLGEKEQKLKEKKRKSRTPGRGRGGATPGKKRRKIEDSTSKRRGRKKKDESESDGDGLDAEASSGDEDLEVEEVEGLRLTFKESEEEDDDDDEDYEAKHKPQKKASKASKNEAHDVDEKVSHDEEESEGDQGPKKSAKSESKSGANDFSLGVKIPKASSPDITRSTSKPPDKVYTKGSRKKNKELKEKEILEKEKEKEREKEKLKEKEVPERKRRGKEKEKSKEKNPEKATGRGGRRGKEAIKKKKNGDIPTDEVLQNEIRDLLKDLSPSDFSKVTFMDIVIQLEKKFNVDLSVKKAHVKLLIRQEVSRLAEEATDEEAPAEADAPAEGEDEAQAEETAVGSPEGKTSLGEGGDGDKDADSDGPEESGDASGETAAKDVDAGETSETVEGNKSDLRKDAKKEVEQSVSTSTAEETGDGGAAETD
ncbi:protein DEK [Marchantia polymorpha subsp. ruderalis]|uniref:DEK-C domain-containing protein n=2 Tax=Marchantia polymorpha TaxID=3197 RepID=A0A176VFR9_MARPO|nr:hypothetical protein AXG93_2958s1190 [Marchantia polymorpha subsp. ruderalis]PTQ35989.1 hypothetical protein MARPO_0067s0068 [Marchantia polymorpha]BBN18046.1 hypothetical protein Mp_7g19100 [Marchantia polymorpha subsp. ruderalis]|eukprot:PTQ35989.1 hypothetical protein MARPO_0067s0068 [Marchantia polymorpha]